MKPKEFDELIRQKFDQNDFAYNPKNWDSLAEQLDGRAKKRSIIMWWLMPLAGVAASVALAMVGIRPVIHENETGNKIVKTQPVEQRKIEQSQPPVYTAPIADAGKVYTGIRISGTTNVHNKHAKGQVKEENLEEEVRISYQNAFPASQPLRKKTEIDLLNKPEVATTKNKEKKKELARNEPVNTFKQEPAKKPSGFSLILTGGYSQGTVITGYMAGLTVRKMVNKSVFVESDVAFASSNNTQSGTMNVPVTIGGGAITGVSNSSGISFSNGSNTAPVAPPSPIGPDPNHASYTNPSARTAPVGAKSSAPAAKTTSGGTDGGQRTTVDGNNTGNNNQIFVRQSVTQNYTQSYAQITPSIGVKITKKIAVGAGPDFQQSIGGDHRPESFVSDRENIQRAPLFDVGMVAKSEFNVTKNIKAGVYYRKGINNVLTPNGSFTDRDYMQFQLKWAIFNK